MVQFRNSPLPVLGAAFGAILVTLALMVAASDSLGRALVARHETEGQLAELSYGADRMQARVSEQISTLQDYLRTPSSIRLQLYRTAHQAVLDQLGRTRQSAGARAELRLHLDRLQRVTADWDQTMGPATAQLVDRRETGSLLTPEMSARLDELALAYNDALRDYTDELDDLREANRDRGQALADQFQWLVRFSGLIGALLVIAVGAASSATIHRSLAELARSRRAIMQAQESIRRDVAERLHGEVQGKLLALELQLRQALGQLDNDPAAARESIDGIVERLVLVRDTARAVSHQLHPAILRMGLPAALRSLRDGLEPGVTVELEVAPAIEARELRRSFGVSEGALPLPDEVRLTLYRLVQEAVNNAVRHGGAETVSVRLWQPRADQVAVSVEDRGRGLPRGIAPGLGLTSLRGALETLGGRLEVSGGPGRGTRVLGIVPVPAEPSANGRTPREVPASAS